MFTIDELKQQIRAMGIEKDDTVLIHTSMRAVGPVENGADGVIDAFCQVLSDGLFLVPTHTWAVVNRDNPVYDVRSTVPNIGALPACAAFRKDGIRSLHPTHSIWGHGADAQTFLRGEEKAHTPAPVGGAWNRLAERNAKILLIGIGNERNTFIHAVDEIADMPNRICPDAFDATVYDWQGREYHTQFCRHQTIFRGEEIHVSELFVNFDRAFTELGVWKEGKLGNAKVMVVDSAKCRDTILKIYSRTNEDLWLEIRDLDPKLWR